MTQEKQKIILNISSHSCVNCGHQWSHSQPHIAAHNGSFIGSALIRPQEMSNLELIAAIQVSNQTHPFCFRCAPSIPGIAFSWGDLSLRSPQKPASPAAGYASKSLDDLLD